MFRRCVFNSLLRPVHAIDLLGDRSTALTVRSWGVATFAWGPASIRLYPHGDLPADAVVDELRAQATLASEHGFAGVMVSEHHGGFAGYMPNPLQLAGWLLDAMPRGYAAACPLLLPLRPPALVAEEVAWLAARFPQRVAVGFAAGALSGDFEIMDVSMENLTARFATALAEVTRWLSGGADDGLLARDPAIARCADHPVPIVSAAASVTRGTARGPNRHRHHLRLAVDTAAVPRADGRLPRRRRIRPVRAHPARMDR